MSLSSLKHRIPAGGYDTLSSITLVTENRELPRSAIATGEVAWDGVTGSGGSIFNGATLTNFELGSFINVTGMRYLRCKVEYLDANGTKTFRPVYKDHSDPPGYSVGDYEESENLAFTSLITGPGGSRHGQEVDFETRGAKEMTLVIVEGSTVAVNVWGVAV